MECGFRCTVFDCPHMRDLEAHHINSRPSDNRKENLIMLCPNHHSMATTGTIDRKACQMYKERRSSTPITTEQILETIKKTTKETLQSELKKIIQRNTTKFVKVESEDT